MINTEEALDRLKTIMSEKGYSEIEITDMMIDCAVIFAYLKENRLRPSQRTIDVLDYCSSEIKRSLN